MSKYLSFRNGANWDYEPYTLGQDFTGNQFTTSDAVRLRTDDAQDPDIGETFDVTVKSAPGGATLWSGQLRVNAPNQSDWFTVTTISGSNGIRGDGTAAVVEWTITHGTVADGVTLTPADQSTFLDGADVDILVNGDPATRYKLMVDSVQSGTSFLGFAAVTLDDPGADLTIGVEVDSSLPLVEEPTWSEDVRLLLFPSGGGVDSGDFSLPDLSGAGVYIIPSQGSVGVTPSNVGGFWTKVGIRSTDGRALPPGTWACQVYSSNVWVDVAGWVIGDNQKASGVGTCFILKDGMREFRLRLITEGLPASPPTELPSGPDGETSVETEEQEAGPEIVDGVPVGPPKPEDGTPPTSPTIPELPTIPEANEACVCSPYYVAIAEQLEYANMLFPMELEYLADTLVYALDDLAGSIEWVGDEVGVKLDLANEYLGRIADALEEIADKPPVEVCVESGYSHSVQYPVSGCAGQEIDQYLDGRY